MTRIVTIYLIDMTHRELCLIGAKYLKNKGIKPFIKCQYVVCELERAGESPDVFGWGSGITQMIEAKSSRADFLADRTKPWRLYPATGIGEFRSYICPAGLINADDLPAGWGLLWVDDRGMVSVIVTPRSQETNRREEVALISSILRREGIKPAIFSYKKYKTD